MRSWALLTAVIVSTSSVRSEYGDKVRSNTTSSSSSSENFASSEEYYDDSLEERQTSTPDRLTGTTTDNGVIIEKAIPSAEVTPKTSYNNIHYPIIYDESLGNSFTQAKFSGNNEFSGYSSTDASTSQEDVKPNKNLNAESMHESSQTHSGYVFPSWSFLEMYNIPSQTTHKPFSASYKNPSVLGIEPTETNEVNNNGNGPSEEGANDPVANGDFLHLGDYSSSHSPWLFPSVNMSPEVSARLEEEKQYQIQSTKFYLKQVKDAQEYASKVQALQGSLYPSFHPLQTQYPGYPVAEFEQSYSFSTSIPPQTSISIVVPENYEHGVNSISQDNSYYSHSLAPNSQTTAAQVNSLTGDRVSQFAPTTRYTGPTASPLVLPSGYLVDTEEVMLARIAHLQALMKAIESSSAWKSLKSEIFVKK